MVLLMKVEKESLIYFQPPIFGVSKIAVALSVSFSRAASTYNCCPHQVVSGAFYFSCCIPRSSTNHSGP
jgi:hypothetical protein